MATFTHTSRTVAGLVSLPARTIPLTDRSRPVSDAAYSDERVLDAQRRNAERMPDEKLLREFRQVSLYPEQPPIRLAYIETLRVEIARRGLTEPAL